MPKHFQYHKSFVQTNKESDINFQCNSERSIHLSLSPLVMKPTGSLDPPEKSVAGHSDADLSGVMSPAVRVLLETYHLDARLIPATGPKGRLLKGDVLRMVAQGGQPFTKLEEEKEDSVEVKQPPARTETPAPIRQTPTTQGTGLTPP